MTETKSHDRITTGKCADAPGSDWSARGWPGPETKDAVRRHDSDSRLSDQATRKQVGSTCLQRDFRDVGIPSYVQLGTTWTPRQGSRWKPGK